jgi:hypothetical protein
MLSVLTKAHDQGKARAGSGHDTGGAVGRREEE